MEKQKHTQGEWKVRFFNDKDPDSDFFVECKPDLDRTGIEIMQDDYGDHNGYPRDQRLADAALIAAAPELLKVCIEALAYHQGVIPK